MANRMSTLLDKIERRLGTIPLNLPDEINKDSWAKVIEQDTIPTFSRYFPNAMNIRLDTSKKSNDGYYFIDEDIAEGVEILGVRDIDWINYPETSLMQTQAYGYGIYDAYNNTFSMDDIMLAQGYADQASLFNTGIYLDYKPPNKIKVTTTMNSDLTKLGRFGGIPITLLIQHAPNLMTIEPTKMEIFERLAIADVASMLYQYLKNYDGLETVFANIDLKLSELQDQANKRDDVINEMKEGYVSAANKYQPMMFTVD